MHHQIPPKYDIPSWPSLCTLWKTRSKSRDLCWINCFVIFRFFSLLFMKSAPLFIQKVPLFMKTNKTMSICVYTCTIYTYIHHQIPPKYKIYLVGLPSVLYKTGKNKRSMLNQLFLLILVLFIESAGFIQKVPLFGKNNKTRSICVYMCTIYTYMHHHIPTKNDIPSWPSLWTLWKTRSKWETCVKSDVFVVFQSFSWKAPLFIQKVPLFMKTNKTRSICVYTYTTKYHQNITYT